MARNTKPARDASTYDRVRPQFAVVRAALIHALAGKGTPTSEIAEALGVNRSYVIRLTEFGMKPASPAEKAIAKMAGANENALRRLGMGFAFSEGFTTTLAGDDGKRGKGGGRPKKDAEPTPKRAAKAAKPKPAPKAAKSSPKPVAKAKTAKVAKAPAKPKPEPKKAKAPAKAAKPKPIRNAKVGKRAAPKKASTPAADPAATMEALVASPNPAEPVVE